MDTPNSKDQDKSKNLDEEDIFRYYTKTRASYEKEFRQKFKDFFKVDKEIMNILSSPSFINKIKQEWKDCQISCDIPEGKKK